MMLTRHAEVNAQPALTLSTAGLPSMEGIQHFEVRGNQLILTLDNTAASAMAEAPIIDETQVMDAVVKIFCTHTEPNFSMPWQRKRQYQSTSSGFMVFTASGTRAMLTTAHSVEYHSQVKVKRRGGGPKVPGSGASHGGGVRHCVANSGRRSVLAGGHACAVWRLA